LKSLVIHISNYRAPYICPLILLSFIIVSLN